MCVCVCYHVTTALVCSLASAVVAVSDLFFAQTKHPLVHWRTIVPFTLNGVVLLLLLLLLQLSLEGDSLPTVLVGTLGGFLLVCSIASLVIVYVAPVPTILPLKGPHTRVGTCNFTIPIALPTDAQRYKDRYQYDLTVQVWYPLADTTTTPVDTTPVDTTPVEGCCGSWFPRRATLWTSGHPSHQTHEAMELLAASAKSSSLKPTLLKHLALATTNAEVSE
jgi:hypothetical protein